MICIKCRREVPFEPTECLEEPEPYTPLTKAELDKFPPLRYAKILELCRAKPGLLPSTAILILDNAGWE